MSATHIPVQDPSMSPTYSISTNTNPIQAPSVSSIRRNLFAGHLSRRPVAPVSQESFGPASPTSQDGHSRPDLYSGPSLQPTKRSMAFQDIYDPNVSPSNYPISPSTSSAMFPRDSIVAVHPVTGRPLLPDLPTLPSRLRLSEEDEEDAGSDREHEQEQQMDFPQHGFPRSPSYHNNLNLSSDLGFDPDMDSSELERTAMLSRNPHSHLGLDHVLDSNSEESHRDRERIERLLADMQARQRARARTIAAPTMSESNTTSSISNSSSQASRARRSAPGKARDRRNPDYHPPSSPPKFNASVSADLALGGIGASMDPSEKDELMGLIMTSLRRKLQAAEDEGWMYGGTEGLGGISGMGLESDAVANYD